ncbi:MAG TPA: hypothetical protein PKD47_11485, partial [Solirubrobacterales bacterium]|nr:hypothetical protein [Solirubrobacterales bacterium]
MLEALAGFAVIDEAPMLSVTGTLPVFLIETVSLLVSPGTMSLATRIAPPPFELWIFTPLPLEAIATLGLETGLLLVEFWEINANAAPALTSNVIAMRLASTNQGYSRISVVTRNPGAKSWSKPKTLDRQAKHRYVESRDSNDRTMLYQVGGRAVALWVRSPDATGSFMTSKGPATLMWSV